MEVRIEAMRDDTRPQARPLNVIDTLQAPAVPFSTSDSQERISIDSLAGPAASKSRSPDIAQSPQNRRSKA